MSIREKCGNITEMTLWLWILQTTETDICNFAIEHQFCDLTGLVVPVEKSVVIKIIQYTVTFISYTLFVKWV